MANTFYVRTADKNQYVEAKFLTDLHGNFVVSSNPIQSSFNLFDASHNPIGTNKNGYIIVPANFYIKTAIDFGRSISKLKNWPIASDLAPARFANAFRPNGWLDIQTIIMARAVKVFLLFVMALHTYSELPGMLRVFRLIR